MLASGASICVNSHPRLTPAKENTHNPGHVIARTFRANVKEPELIRQHSSISADLPDNRRVSDQTATIPESTAAKTSSADHGEVGPVCVAGSAGLQRGGDRTQVLNEEPRRRGESRPTLRRTGRQRSQSQCAEDLWRRTIGEWLCTCVLGYAHGQAFSTRGNRGVSERHPGGNLGGALLCVGCTVASMPVLGGQARRSLYEPNYNHGIPRYLLLPRTTRKPCPHFSDSWRFTARVEARTRENPNQMDLGPSLLTWEALTSFGVWPCPLGQARSDVTHPCSRPLRSSRPQEHAFGSPWRPSLHHTRQVGIFKVERVRFRF